MEAGQASPQQHSSMAVTADSVVLHTLCSLRVEGHCATV